MDTLPLLAMLIGLPIIVLGGFFYLTFKLLGKMALRIVCIALALLCTYQLILSHNSPPILGNKSFYAAMADLTAVILILACLADLLWPLGRRYLEWEKTVDARWAAEAEDRSRLE